MDIYGWIQILFYFGVLLLSVVPLGAYMAKVYQGEKTFLTPLIEPVEDWIYRVGGVNPDEEMDWKTYSVAFIGISAVGYLFLYLLQRAQGYLSFNPQGFGNVPPYLAFNTAVSFVTNTNWQAYSGESSLNFITQMLGLTVQNFISAAAGMAVLMVLIRALVRNSVKTIGNFWVDLLRGVLYILLPISIILALLLVSQGVVQTFSDSLVYHPLQSSHTASDSVNPEGRIALGPVASQVAIKQLGTNGGGYYGANSAVPFENSTPFANLLEMLSILLIPAGLCITFGIMVKDVRQGWAILIAMLIILALFLGILVHSELQGNPQLGSLGVSMQGGNMEGKETRFGVVNSALWAAVTTAASNGSVNSMHDSYMPLGGFSQLILMELGEVVFGGVGSGLFGMLCFVIVAVFTAGLMVGRTPEYLGKKIEPYEMKMASLVILIMPIVVLGFTALAVLLPAGKEGISNPGPHGFSQVLYAFTSQGNNNGSAFAGLTVNTPFYNTLGGLAMLIGRFWLAIPVLAMAGSLVRKKKIPASAGTLPTHTPLFVTWLISVVLIVGALNFLPALALGPIIEHLLLLGI